MENSFRILLIICLILLFVLPILFAAIEFIERQLVAAILYDSLKARANVEELENPQSNAISVMDLSL